MGPIPSVFAVGCLNNQPSKWYLLPYSSPYHPAIPRYRKSRRYDWKIRVHIYIINIHIYTSNDLYFWRSTPQNKAFSNQNKGHLGSRYIYISRWWFHIFFIFTPTWGNDPICRAYFFNWVVQPPTRYIYIIYYVHTDFENPNLRCFKPDKTTLLGMVFFTFLQREDHEPPSSLGRFYMGINWQWNEFGSPKICWNTFLWCIFLANLNLLGQYA